MLKKLFGLDKKEEKTMPEADGKDVVYAPLTGEIKPLSEVPDPTFSEKMMGDGIAIEPSQGTVVAPVDGEIMQIFPTNHAVGIRTVNGVEILIHIGLETVNMNGEGFTGKVKEGDKVNIGDPLVEFDMDLVKEKAASTITPIIVTNGDVVSDLQKEESGQATAKETTVMTIKTQG
ncbi:PTS sugar transporter subunit IIA [Texcoconibacillus texcoconensis]|uniref:PTS system glucose-specific IIA component n=1 Tax=Texcoconibacillus texcoconensis TaxID=1095777 RepID=A0A840QNR7_9BACI|nr:PTS glucose transporter subunit IIA [Texcoconibacillus texcoconensis]MBB5173000.1 PTS system glucose-specific IIA component [Texcoconibacillus texcoconensis]